MSEAIKLEAIVRQGIVGDKKETIPAVMYGSGVENTSLSVKRIEFENVFAKSGESGLISLQVKEGEVHPVIIKDYQIDPVRQRIIHIDFYKVNMKEKVVAEVSLEFLGEAPAVKTHGGIVVHNFDALEIECLPGDLMQKIEIDVSKLENVGDAIYVSDIKLPEGVVFKHEPTDIVVHVVEPTKMVEETPVVAEGEAAPVAEGEPKAEEKKEETK